MLNLAEYARRPTRLADYLPWAALVAPGVVLNKDGSFQRTMRFRGPDLDSATDSELVAATARLNNALKRLGSGWALYVDADRRPAPAYPDSDFPDALSALVDAARRAAFAGEDEDMPARHFESGYHLTLAWLPPAETRARARGLLVEGGDRRSVDWREQCQAFAAESDRIAALVETIMPEAAWLDDAETLTYLHGAVSAAPKPVAVPETPVYLDALLGADDLVGGLSPMLGDRHLRLLTVRGFPASTWPGLLDDLNRLGFPYRWTTRFLCLGKDEAERQLVRLRRQWFAKRKGVVSLLREVIYQQEVVLVDSDAANKSADADLALQALGSDAVAFGHVTATLLVSARDEGIAAERARAVERIVQGRGFVTMNETLNAVEAWLSTLPGHAYANVRQPLISTVNLVHMLPVSAVWAGPERNAHLDGPPLIVTRTDGATPFRFSPHVGDVGHTLVVGPTGAGKSVLLGLIALQFRRYPGARIFLFDKGGSARATILGMGGEHYDLGAGDEESALAFQPLSGIDADPERIWAAEWIAGLVAHEGVALDPPVKDAIWAGLMSLASAPREERTLTGLSALLASNPLRQALAPYTLAGPHGRLLDADHDRLGSAQVQAFEMEELMHARSAVLPVLTYLFHRLEQRFDGAPTLLILDEAWVFLDDPLFAGRIREWLKVLRKKNVAVIFATQSLADIQRSTIAPAIVESCPSRLFLPNPQATEPQLKEIYQGFGLNARQIAIIAQATPKRDYYYQSPLGNRLFDLDIGQLALAFLASAGPADQRVMDNILAEHGAAGFAAQWARHRGLAWAADLLAPSPHEAKETSP
ncbi:conjugal transfer protein TrbE [Sphingomonas sp. BT-65]|uniref:conjugal transfer protein TrbE n=1 Tax=Sphingomonas sp. BT-65 TaxID=2989821 RepID=UPI002235F591|nr:conjugal transfer protein TrbE [Sphingomonas sp. BT-65]MCW4460813.1 conjugal transfer protein TrbE [Sphingomonas sp. BT-65]